MSIWFFELFAPETLVRYVAVFLIVVALAMPTLVLVRVMALIGGVVGVILAAFVEVDRAGLVWWSLLTLVVLARLLLRDPRGMLGRITAEELAFRSNVVPELSRRQTRLLVRQGKWHDVEAGHVFTREGQLVNELVYLASGRVDSLVESENVGSVEAGALVGEVGVSTGETATATTVSATPVRYLGFDVARLYPFLDDHPVIQDAVELAVDRNLREKLKRANLAAAHAAEGH